MPAVDTNILVRAFITEDLVQSAKGKALVASEPIVLLTTVLLETDWVLRSAYGFSRMDVVSAFEAFAGLPGVTFEEPERAVSALHWARSGMDFADALHLAGAGADGLATFDRKLASTAAKLGAAPVRLL